MPISDRFGSVTKYYFPVISFNKCSLLSGEISKVTDILSLLGGKDSLSTKTLG